LKRNESHVFSAGFGIRSQAAREAAARAEAGEWETNFGIGITCSSPSNCLHTSRFFLRRQQWSKRHHSQSFWLKDTQGFTCSHCRLF
jgi:hypothetical protein